MTRGGHELRNSQAGSALPGVALGLSVAGLLLILGALFGASGTPANAEPSGTPTPQTVTWTGQGTTNGACSNFQSDANLNPASGQQGWLFILTQPTSSSWTLSATFGSGAQAVAGVQQGDGSVHFIVYTPAGATLLSASATNGSENSVLTISHCELGATPTATSSPTATATDTPVPSTPTATFTPIGNVLETATATATETSPSATPTSTTTETAATGTATSTPATPTATGTAPTSTPTATGTAGTESPISALATEVAIINQVVTLGTQGGSDQAVLGTSQQPTSGTQGGADAQQGVAGQSQVAGVSSLPSTGEAGRASRPLGGLLGAGVLLSVVGLLLFGWSMRYRRV